MTEANYYVTGGSLRIDAPAYVVRKADQELYIGLKSGQPCCVLNCRQVGKSSLRVRVGAKLEAEGWRCAEVYMSQIGGDHTEIEEWYANMISVLNSELGLKVNVEVWLQARGQLSAQQRLSEFVETVVLEKVSENVVIFFEEIDDVRNLNFSTDDFFAYLRTIYEKKAHQPQYRRLTFALFGVIASGNLIRNKTRPPFNIGLDIDLQGFGLTEEIRPLAAGLRDRVVAPYVMLEKVLFWTRGQPFLTQVLCRLIAESEEAIVAGDEERWLQVLVRREIVGKCFVDDRQLHFATIRDRVANDEGRICQLLSLYQKVISEKKVATDGSTEQTELLLSGLVVKREGNLEVYNPIYELVFDEGWVEAALARVRPYAEAISRWLASGKKDDRQLLRGRELEEALCWAGERILGSDDYEFLSAAQKLQTGGFRSILSAFALGVPVVLIAVAIFALWNIQQALNASQMRERAAVIDVLLLTEPLTGLAQAIQATGQSFSDPEILKLLQPSLLTASEVSREKSVLRSDKAPIKSLAISPDGRTVASGGSDGTVHLWPEQKDAKSMVGPRPFLNSVAVSRDVDGKQIVVAGGSGGRIHIWKEGKKVAPLEPAGKGIINSVAIGGQSGKMSIASGHNDGTVSLWNLKGQKVRSSPARLAEFVNSVAIGGGGDLLASGTGDGRVILWYLRDDQLCSLPGVPIPHTDSVAISRDGRLVAAGGSDGTVSIWYFDETSARPTPRKSLNRSRSVSAARVGIANVQTCGTNVGDQWKLLGSFAGHAGAVRSVAIDSAGALIASGSSDGTIRFFSAKGNPVGDPLRGHNNSVNAVVFGGDGKTVYSGGSDGTFRLWDSPARPVSTEASQRHGHSVESIALATSLDGPVIVSSSNRGRVGIFNSRGNLRNGKFLEKFKDFETPLRVAVTRDGKRVATGDIVGRVRIFDLSGNDKYQLKQEDTLASPIDSIDIGGTEADTVVVTGHSDGTVVFWDGKGKRQNKPQSQNDRHRGPVRSVALSPDAKTAVSGGQDGTVRLWNSGGQLVESTRPKGRHSGSVNSVAFDRRDRNGRTVYSSGSDGVIRRWDFSDNLVIEYKGPLGSIYPVAIHASDDVEIAVSGGSDGAIYAWDLEGNPLFRLAREHEGEIKSLAIGSNGRTVAMGDSRGATHFWDIQELLKGENNDWRKWLRTSCERLKDHSDLKELKVQATSDLKELKVQETCNKELWKK